VNDDDREFLTAIGVLALAAAVVIAWTLLTR
jgi:hypothetical protein